MTTSRADFNEPALIILVGPSASGKSTWAATHFAQSETVCSDTLRALVGTGESDLEASADAFAVLRLTVEARCRRRLTTVIDTLGTDSSLRQWLRERAAEHTMTCHVVIIATPLELCLERNRERERKVPVKVITTQHATIKQLRPTIDQETFTLVHVVDADAAADRPRPASVAKPEAVTSAASHLRFGLHFSTFPGPAATLRARMTSWATAAETTGFDSLWVMDHFRQIPQIGREWDDMCESTTALAFLAGVTERVTLGSLVHGITHRNLGVLGKSLATLDVLSGGRAVCGLGLGWFEKEQRAYGIDPLTVNGRYELLEDALQFLPLLWGKGSPAFEGRRFSSSEALGYPRPLQEHVPILIGGSGERRTLRLVAQYADACNFFGDPANVAHKRKVLNEHCHAIGRDPSTISVTHLRTVMVESTADRLAKRLDVMRVPKPMVASLNPGTVNDHVASTKELIEAGVDHVIVSLVGINDDEISRYGEVIEAFQ
jgi:alkanesulfonate monooxygenase SsuD/methylene tetrahydromethanopterin reductase-like flavin-dependent oxidoreductase (luciferase family)/predicted kinase